eukprot:gene2231-biopygen7391
MGTVYALPSSGTLPFPHLLRQLSPPPLPALPSRRLPPLQLLLQQVTLRGEIATFRRQQDGPRDGHEMPLPPTSLLPVLELQFRLCFCPCVSVVHRNCSSEPLRHDLQKNAQQ